MVYSMTGFGRAETQINDRLISVEIKSLNGKQLDINTRLSPVLRAYELDIRNLMANQLLRGTIDIAINVKQGGAAKPMVVNTELATYYYHSICQIAHELGLPQEQHMLSTIVRMPEVVTVDQDILSKSEWETVCSIIGEAAQTLMAHRKSEGAMLQQDLKTHIKNIADLLAEVLPLETQRTEKLRLKLKQSLQEMQLPTQIDQNRFEQELIYYIERIDINEEKTRLKQHCNYFLETLHLPDIAKGKKLGFILQEIGREINTLGSKANDAAIQKIVVQMKDELEKAKEQSLNVL
jgi:uncharacterized protein (TIGR00255 family)